MWWWSVASQYQNCLRTQCGSRSRKSKEILRITAETWLGRTEIATKYPASKGTSALKNEYLSNKILQNLAIPVCSNFSEFKDTQNYERSSSRAFRLLELECPSRRRTLSIGIRTVHTIWEYIVDMVAFYSVSVSCTSKIRLGRWASFVLLLRQSTGQRNPFGSYMGQIIVTLSTSKAWWGEREMYIRLVYRGTSWYLLLGNMQGNTWK